MKVPWFRFGALVFVQMHPNSSSRKGFWVWKLEVVTRLPTSRMVFKEVHLIQTGDKHLVWNTPHSETWRPIGERGFGV